MVGKRAVELAAREYRNEVGREWAAWRLKKDGVLGADLEAEIRGKIEEGI